jgi:hypothetical protein
VRAEEVPVEARPAVLGAYIRANRRLNGRFFDVPAHVTADDLRRIAPRHAVLRVIPA